MKKLLALLLASMMLVAVLVACQVNGSGSSDTQKPAVTGSDETQAAVPDETSVSAADDLPELDFDGKTFRMLSYRGANTFEGNGWVLYLDIDEPTEGELLEQAAFERNADLKDRFKVEFELEADVFNWNNEHEDIAYFRNVIGASGDDMYDIAILQSSGVETLLIEEYLYDLNDLSYIDWDKPYYVQGMNDVYHVGSHQYILFSHIQYPCFSTPAIIVNRDILQNRGHTAEELYQMVDDKEWTLDALSTLIEGYYTDVNNDGKRDLGDEYGFASTQYGPVYFFPAAGMKGTYVTDTGFEFDYGTDKAVAVMEKILAFVNNQYVYREDWDFAPFKESRAMFTVWASELRALRDWDINYGILPIPLYEEGQDRYYAVVSGTPLLVPYTISDPDFVGAMIEAMAAGSYKYLTPAFYTNFMQQKVIQDDGSRANWERMMGEWATSEFVRYFSPDARLADFGIAKDCITSNFAAYASSWDKQKDSVARACAEFFGYFMKD